VNQSKRHTLTKEEYGTCKKNAERYVLERYPDLKQKKLISKESSYKDDMEQLKKSIEAELGRAKTVDQFYSNLKQQGYSYRVRGKTHTFVIDKTQKRHRIKKLGLEAEYFNFLINAGKDPSKIHEKAQSDYSAGKGKKDRVANSAKEWVTGDFSKRDKRTQQKKYKKQNEFDKTVKGREDQTTFENATETMGEWVTGDFSKRDARARNKKKEEFFKKRNAKQSSRPDVNHKEDMSASERFKVISQLEILVSLLLSETKIASGTFNEWKSSNNNQKSSNNRAIRLLLKSRLWETSQSEMHTNKPKITNKSLRAKCRKKRSPLKTEKI